MPRVLVVEDNYLIADWIKAQLESRGFRVVGPVALLSQALEAVQNEALDGALLDINLGGEGTSFPIAAGLQARKVPFLFITAHDVSEMMPFEFRTVQRLPKPVDFGILATVMLKHFAHRAGKSGARSTQ